MAKTKWAIALPKVIQRASIELGGKTIIEYIPRLELGLHESNIAAKRAYLEWMEPDLIGCDDDFIQLHWRYCVNTGCAKIVKIKEKQNDNKNYLSPNAEVIGCWHQCDRIKTKSE